MKVYEQSELENLEYMERHPKKVNGTFDPKEEDAGDEKEVAEARYPKRKTKKQAQ